MKILEKKEQIVAAILVVTFIILLIPVLYLGKFDYHCADDFGYSAASHIAWEDTHSVDKVFQAAASTVVERWYTWQGTFTTMFFMALEPGLYGDVFYHFVPWLMIGAMSIATMLLLYILLVKMIGCSKALWISISMLYLIYALECIVDPTQGFYWYNGASHYMLPHALALILASIVLCAIVSKRQPIVLEILACILAFLIGGSNYITALNTAIAFVLGIGLAIILKKKSVAIRIVLPFICFMPAFLLNAFAPGNQYRQVEMMVDHPGPIKAIFLSFYFCLESVTEYWMNWTTVMFILLLIPFALLVVKELRDRYGFRYPLVVLFFSYGFLSAMFTPTAYVSAATGGGRVDNIIFLDLLLLIVLNVIYVLGWLDQKLKLVDRIRTKDIFDNKMMQYYLTFMVVCTMFFAGLYTIVDANFFVTTAAVKSIISGEAAGYGEETKVRTQMIEACDTNELRLPRFQNQPYLLYNDDIIDDPMDWRNLSMERYYRIERISAYEMEK